MNYYNFITKTKKYLKSVRVIKDYVSFDMQFSDRWVIKEEHFKKVEIVKNKSVDETIVLSFVTPFSEEKINEVEETIDSIIKFNIEKEEKENLFRNKVQELRSIFENKKLDDLKNLKFDIDELKSFIEIENKNGQEDTERDRELRNTETEKSV